MSLDTATTSRWYTQFWAWFVIGILLVSVLTGTALLILALRNPEHLVVTNYYEVGKGINQSLERERLAQHLEIRAYLVLDEQKGLAQLKLAGNSQPEQLILKLISPTQPERDQSLVLQRTEPQQYQGYLSESAAQSIWGRRFIEVLGQEQGQDWRLYVEHQLRPLQTLELTP